MPAMDYLSYHMYREILEEPQAVARMVEMEGDKIRGLARILRERDIDCIVIAARGTSDNAAQLAKYLFEYINGVPVSLAAPSIYTLYGARVKLDKALVLGVSQSGEGLDVVEVVKHAREAGAVTIGITNNEGSALARTAEHTIFCRAGEEKSVAATKTYVTQLMAFYMLSFEWAGRSDLLGELSRAPEYLDRVLTMEEGIREIVPRYRYMKECVVTGRGFNYSTALEAALKVKETCYVGSQPYSVADFLHGPIAIVEEGFPVFVIAPPGKAFPNFMELCTKLRTRKAETIVLSSAPEILDISTVPLRIPFELEEVLTPLVYITPMQLFSFHLALVKGFNPDRPRGLKKVTVTR
ncbi:MAG TPA: SIS domain-containing protein [Firmicutes bacterium]|nr:SIS domain-containing protein [Bacillota bacterium]